MRDFKWPWIPRKTEHITSVSGAREQIRNFAHDPRLATQTKVNMLAEIRRDLRELLGEYAGLADLENHPGWIKLRQKVKDICEQKLQNWRGRIFSDPEGLRYDIVFVECCETIMGIQAHDKSEHSAITTELEMSPDQMAAVALGTSDEPSGRIEREE